MWNESRMIRTTLRSLLAAAVLLPAAWAQEAAVTRRAVDLRDAPGDKGRSVASLPAQAAVTRTPERQGPWVQVRTATGATGWLHMFDMGPAASAPSEGGVASNALRGVTSLFGGNRRPQGIGGTAGIRGLDAQDIEQAQPDPGAVTRMEAQRQNDTDVRNFAQRSNWRAATVEPLPEPARGSAPAVRNPSQQESP